MRTGRSKETDQEHARQLGELRAEIDRVRTEIGDLREVEQIRLTMDWLATSGASEGPLISVVMPTRDRRERLESAIASVFDQTHANWELLVVDDGSVDDTAGFLEGITDPRVRSFRTDGLGCPGARNVALDHAEGAIVAYLDDDNHMHRLWLTAVAWASENWPETDVFYGARIFDNFERAHGLGESGLPWLQYNAWDRERLENFNIADINVIAHRRSLPDTRFDESLSCYDDWDFLLRLTQLAPPVRIPAVACAYSTDGSDRLSAAGEDSGELERIRNKLNSVSDVAAAPGQQRAKVLMVGLDAFDIGTARNMVADGELPHLAKLLDRSVRVPVRSPVGVHPSAGWPSITTGRTVCEHGRHCWVETTTDYEDRWTHTDEVRGTPFWEELGRAGNRSALLDVPHMLPNAGHDGVQLIEFGCHDRHTGSRSVPESLLGELTRRFGAHPVGGIDPGSDQTFSPCDYAHREGDRRTPEESRALLDDLLVGQARKEAVSLHLLGEGGWDLFFTVLGESHCTGHQLWASHDPAHPWHDPAVVAEIGDPIRTVYRRLDRALGRHIAAAGDEATVLMVVPHGMGPHYSGTPLLDTVLHRIETADDGGPQGGFLTRAAKSAWTHLPDRFEDSTRRRAAKLLGRRVVAGATTNDAIPDRSTRRWFSPPCDEPFGPIRLNVVGRERAGRIHPGSGYDRACAHLREELLGLINVETGERAVRDVIRSDSICPTCSNETLPDLWVDWVSDRPVEAVYSPRTGLVVKRQTHWRTGDHPPGGLLLASGPGIATDADLPPINGEDVAPTVCALFDVALPDSSGTVVRFPTRSRTVTDR